MPRTFRARAAVATACVALVASTFAFTAAQAADASTITNALQYLASQQNGGTDPSTGSGAWDTSPSSPFTTYDVVLAIAEAAQTSSTWSTSEAHAAVAAFHNADGESPLPFLDLMAADISTPGVAGKTAVMLAGPLGLSYTAYDPNGDGSPRNLVTLVGSPMPNGAYDDDGHFNNTLFAALAAHLFTGSIAVSTVSYVEGCQQMSGAFAFNCDQIADDADIDTTSLALQTLVAGGVAATDPVMVKGLNYLATQLQPQGYWSAFGSPSSESSSRAMLALTAAGYDVNTPCWRNTVAPANASDPFVAADTGLGSLANPDGSIAGPDSFIPAWSTAQAIAGLLRSWLPTVRATAQQCAVAGPTPTVSDTAPAPGGSMTVSGSGFKPGTQLTVQLFSDPVLLGTVDADGNGDYSIVVTIPVSTPPGSHEIVVTGLGADGQMLRSSVAIQVSASGGGSDPSDGAGVPLRFTG
jgi:hypothetical protein